MKRFDLYAFISIVIINVLVKLPFLTFGSFDLDEAIHLWFAQFPLPDVIARAAIDPNPPLFNILISFWIKAFGTGMATVRWFSLLFSSFAAGALYIFLKRHFGLRMAIIAVVLFTLSAIQLKFAHVARPYAMLVFLAICSYGFMLEVIRRPSIGWLAGYALVTGLMLYAHPTSVFNLPAQGLFLLLHWNENRKAVLAGIGCLALAMSSYLVWYFSISYFDGKPSTWLSPPDYAAAVLAVQYLNGKIGSNVLFQFQLVVLVAALLWLVFSVWGQKGRALLLGLLWAVVPFASNFAFSHVAEPVFEGKYIISAQIGVVVLMAAAIAALPLHRLWMPTFALAAWLMFNNMNWKTTLGEGWREAAALVRADEGERTATFISPWYMQWPFIYYYDNAAYRDFATTQETIYKHRIFTRWPNIVQEITSRPLYSRLHFVYSQPGTQDYTKRLDSLMHHADLVARHDVEGFSIYTFDLRIPVPMMCFDFEDRTVVSNVFIGKDAFGGEGVEQMDKTREFSSTLIIPIDDVFANDTTIEITAQVRSNEGFDGVEMVASLMREDITLAHLQTNVRSIGAPNRWQEVRITIPFKRDEHAGSYLKAYLWNTQGRSFQLDNLKVTAVTP